MRKNEMLVMLACAALALGAAAAQAGFLLIPDQTSDKVNMFDPYDGTYLGEFCAVPLVYGSSRMPYNAALGPDGYVYVTDSSQDAVFRFELDGTLVDTYCGPEDGMNALVGVDFRDNEVFITSSADGFVARFNGPHSRLDNFVTGGGQLMDMHFLPDGRALLSDAYGATDNVRLLNTDGSVAQYVLSNLNYPMQVQSDSQLPGEYLLMEISPKRITDFDLDGTIHSQIVLPLNNTRGVFRLGNGNLLMTRNTGVYEVDPRDGAVIEQQLSGNAMYIEYVPEPAMVSLVLLGGLTLLRPRR